jgi:NRPS condensation-like uncharacterized protein
MTTIPQRIRGESSDGWNFSMHGIFEPQIHLLISFAGAVDLDRLTRALRLAADAEPILGCLWVPRWIWPYWQRIPEAELDAALRPQVTDDPAALDAFLAAKVDELHRPQFRVLLIRTAAGDTLALKVNHMVADSGGTKEVGYVVADLYRRLGDDENYRPPVNRGSRGQWQLFRHFVPGHIFGLLRQHWREQVRNLRPLLSRQLRSLRGETDEPQFAFHRFDAQHIQTLRAFARDAGATLNDMFVAALFRVVDRDGKPDAAARLRVACTVDLRRYLPDKRTGAICNLSSFFFPHLPDGVGPDFATTLARVKTDVDALKKQYFGLPFLFSGNLLLWQYPYALKAKIYRFVFTRIMESGNAGPVLTNLGPIDAARLDFGDLPVVAAEVVVPCTVTSGIAIGLSGYGDTMTLSCGYHSPGPRAGAVEQLLAAITDELPR